MKRASNQQSFGDVPQRGAEATALPTLARLPGAFDPREAFGVRRVHRRFRAGIIVLTCLRLVRAEICRRHLAPLTPLNQLPWQQENNDNSRQRHPGI